MFKQPAENTNATSEEEQRSADRVDPQINTAADHAEIEKEARRLASDRGNENSLSEEDWSHAERIVRNRKISLSKA
jgi:hypothetical protein